MRVLEGMADDKGKREIENMELLNVFCRGDRGWKPVSFPEVMSVVMYWRTIMEADAAVRRAAPFCPCPWHSSTSSLRSRRKGARLSQSSGLSAVSYTTEEMLQITHDRLLNRERLQS